jgi:putative addiction module killer protein
VTYKVKLEKKVLKWLKKLPENQTDSILEIIKMLANRGHELGYPFSKNLKVESVKLKELRCSKFGNRVYYFFHNSEVYICLNAGNKDSQKKDIREARQKALTLGG